MYYWRLSGPFAVSNEDRPCHGNKKHAVVQFETNLFRIARRLAGVHVSILPPLTKFIAEIVHCNIAYIK